MTRINLEELEKRGVTFNNEPIQTIDNLSKIIMNGTHGTFYDTIDGHQLFIPHQALSKSFAELNSPDNS